MTKNLNRWRSHGFTVFGILLIGGQFFGCSTVTTTSQVQKKKLAPKQRAMLYVKMGNAAIVQGDPTGALQTFADAENIYSELPELHQGKAIALFRKHHLNAALESAEKAVQIDPKRPQSRVTLGKILMDMNRGDEAIPHLKLAAENPLYRNPYKPLTTLGIIHYRKGRTQEALKAFDKAIQSSRSLSCVAYYYRGNIKLKRGDLAGSLDDYDRATIEFCGGFVQAHYAQGIALLKLGRYDSARAKLLEVQKLFPQSKLAKQAVRKLREIP